MADHRLIEIADRLLEQSEKGKLDWSETALENRFVVSFPNYSVAIQKEYARSNVYTLAVLNHVGTEIQSLTADSVNSEELFDKLARLHSLAKTVSLNVDKALDDLLAQLSTDA